MSTSQSRIAQNKLGRISGENWSYGNQKGDGVWRYSCYPSTGDKAEAIKNMLSAADVNWESSPTTRGHNITIESSQTDKLVALDESQQRLR